MPSVPVVPIPSPTTAPRGRAPSTQATDPALSDGHRHHHRTVLPARRLRTLAPLACLFAMGLAGCVTDEPAANADPRLGCNGQPWIREGALPDCGPPAPDAEVSPFGRGITFYLVDTENTRVERLVLSAGATASIGAWVGGYGRDDLGCAAQFSTTVVPDETTANQHNLRVWFEYDPTRTCVDLLSARVTVELPALPAGDHVLRLNTGGCLDLECQTYDLDTPYLDVPVSVVP